LADDAEPTQSSESFRSRWAFVSNVPEYGWGAKLAPSARGNDGLLDLCLFRRGSFWAGLQYAAAIQCGWHERLADCTTRQVRRVRVEASEPVPFQLDGDPAGFLPVEVEVAPERITLVAPVRSGVCVHEKR
jgi:diacylglycerol kinase family enzyme